MESTTQSVCVASSPSLARTTGTCRKPRQLLCMLVLWHALGAHLGRARLHESVTAREQALCPVCSTAHGVSASGIEAGRPRRRPQTPASAARLSACSTDEVVFQVQPDGDLVERPLYRIASPGCVYDCTTETRSPCSMQCSFTATCPSSAAAGWAPDTGPRAQRHSVRLGRLHSASTQNSVKTLSQNPQSKPFCAAAGGSAGGGPRADAGGRAPYARADCKCDIET